MAKLKSLYPDFMTMDEEEKTAFIRAYRDKRVVDLQEVTDYSANKAAGRLTDKEKALLKSLGITVKDIKALKQLAEADDDDEEESAIPNFNQED